MTEPRKDTPSTPAARNEAEAQPSNAKPDGKRPGWWQKDAFDHRAAQD
ncbi:MAG TPA: hypothetical protein VEY95_02005 [Azospirillaceae bacterium]|nr:hypothetical protein [Azospirillaceae bacterium]